MNREIVSMKSIAEAYKKGSIPENEVYEIRARDVYFAWSTSQNNANKIAALEMKIASLELEVRALQKKLGSKVRVVYGL